MKKSNTQTIEKKSFMPTLWLNNQNVRNQQKLDIKICIVENGYSPHIVHKYLIMLEQVEHFEENVR